MTGDPGKDDVDCDHSNDDKHPVLAVEAQEVEMLNEKMHALALFFGKA
jgi:hypothetical protein